MDNLIEAQGDQALDCISFKLSEMRLGGSIGAA
jgi:hypothetical protein